MPSKQFLDHMKNMPGGPPPSDPNPWGVPCMPENWQCPLGNVPDGFVAKEVQLNGVRGLFIPGQAPIPKAAMLHIHGGGFTIGSAFDDRSTGLAVRFAQELHLDSYSVDYTLAPWGKFPLQINQCVDFYQGLLEQGYTKIIVGGESAGAGLTLSLTLALKQRGLPLPVALWCSSPIDDILFGQRELYHQDMFTESQDKIFAAYAPGADPKNPLLSPIYGDFSGFPPLLIQAGEEESLSAGCVRLVMKAAAAGVETRFHLGKGMPHTFAMDYSFYPEAEQAFREILTFVQDTLALNEET